MRRFFVAGNWKMNTDAASAVELAKGTVAGLPPKSDRIDIAVCPPFPYLLPVVDAIKGSAVAVGAQNCYFESAGAFTGETSVEMLQDAGCQWVILGHSERRHVLGETNEMINRKIIAASQKGLGVIFCVGETLSEREGNQTELVLDKQLQGGLAGVDGDVVKNLVIAYEPVWAIGTGKTASPDQAESAHLYIRDWLSQAYDDDVAEEVRIQYGGSVKPENADELLRQPNVDGALVGGASLKAESFLGIISAAVALAPQAID